MNQRFTSVGTQLAHLVGMLGLGKSLVVTLAMVAIAWYVARLAGFYFSLGWSLLLTVLFTALLTVPIMLKGTDFFELKPAAR